MFLNLRKTWKIEKHYALEIRALKLINNLNQVNMSIDQNKFGIPIIYYNCNGLWKTRGHHCTYILYKYLYNLYNTQYMWFGVDQLVVTVLYLYV